MFFAVTFSPAHEQRWSTKPERLKSKTPTMKHTRTNANQSSETKLNRRSLLRTSAKGVGCFLRQDCNALIYTILILCIIRIRALSFVLYRLMSFVESRFKAE